MNITPHYDSSVKSQASQARSEYERYDAIALREPSDIEPILDAYIGGDRLAKAALTDGLLYLAFEAADIFCRQNHIFDQYKTGCILGGAMRGCWAAIERLPQTTVTAETVGAYIRKTMWGRMRTARQETIPHTRSKYIYDTYGERHEPLPEDAENFFADKYAENERRLAAMVCHLTETDFERAVLEAMLDKVDRPRTNVLAQVRRAFPDATRRRLKALKAVFKSRFARMLGKTVAELEPRKKPKRKIA